MSRKTARTISSSTLNYAKVASLALILCIATACGDNEDNEPQNPDEPDPYTSIIGKWLRYQRINDDGTISPGDLDEFWIFYTDGSFEKEDGGELTSMGNFTISGDNLSIYSVSIPHNEPRNLTGKLRFENGSMFYTYTDVGKNDYMTYRFIKRG